MERDVRIPLEKGTQITINGSVFTIGDIIGRGGLSLVYSATKEGGMTESVIKEFYPAPDSRGRVYADRDKYGHVHCVDDLFEKQYKDMLHLFETEGPIGGDTASISFQILPFWEYHDGYAVMKKESADMRSLKTLVDEWEQNAPLPPSGKPRENDPIFNNMVRLNYALNIVDSLLSALSAVHEKYIHLDLSSSNVIWACREQTGRTGCAVITDFGSAAVLDENGQFRPNYKLFCSLGFAAPEVFDLQPVFTRKTDLYSVGMLLIYLCIGEKRFMNRFSRIKRPGRLGRYIASIDLQLPKETGSRLNTFLQTALVERKYNTVQKMQAGLRRVRESTQFYLTDNESAVISIGNKIHGGIDDKYYVERKEIKDIAALLDSNEIIFVTGIGGIGKTTLVTRFAKEYADKYFVSFVTYAGSIRNTITELGVRNCDENEWAKMTPDKRFSAGLALLKSSTSNHVLIIDNADSGNNDLRSDPDFHYLQEVPTHIIFTTRNEMEGAGIIRLDRMSDSDCLKLMKSYLPEYKNGQYDGTLLDIIEKVDGHTLTCSLLALTLRDSFKLKPADVLSALEKSELDDKRWHTVKSEYNLDFIPRTVLAHLQTAFNLSELSDEIKKILGCFCLAEHGLTKEYIENLFSEEEWEVILEATSRGWLMCKDERIQEKRYVGLFKDVEDDYLSELVGYSSDPKPHIIMHEKTVYILHPVIRAVCLMDENTKPLWKRNKDFIREFPIAFFAEGKEPIWDQYGEKRKQIFRNIERVDDFSEIENEDVECASLLWLCLRYASSNCPGWTIHDIKKDEYQYKRRCIKISQLLDHKSFLFFVALQTIVSEYRNQLSAHKKLCIHMYLSYMRLNVESMRNSEYVKEFLGAAVVNFSFFAATSEISTEIKEDYLCNKDYSRTYHELSIEFSNAKSVEKLIKSKEVFKSEEIRAIASNTATHRLEQFQMLIMSAMHTGQMEEALLYAKVAVYSNEAGTYIREWAFNPYLHSEIKYAEIRSEWKSGKITKRYIDWFQNEFLKSSLSDANLLDMLSLWDSSPQELLLKLVLLCETGYHVAVKANQENLASEFKEKYLYYLSLLTTHYSDDETGAERLCTDFLRNLLDHPFTPPVLDEHFFDEDIS